MAEKIMVNGTHVFACYISGNFDRFFGEESEAKAFCRGKGMEFNGTYYAMEYKVLQPGSIFISEYSSSVFLEGDKSRYLDPIADVRQLDFVKWVPKSN